jgi:peptidoglycan/xylan/chitin deacetylase (PgdA/CDA1 family)
MRKLLRHAALTAAKSVGVSSLVKSSDWRRQRLLILCYHGISLEDEHEWRPQLYISPQKLERRLEILCREKCTVLPLEKALERLYRNDLPPRSAALTFDDGGYDFYRQALPRLKQHGFPATVYLTSYYSQLQRPIFGLICSYMLWKSRERGPIDLREFGVTQPVDPGDAKARAQAESELAKWVHSQSLRGEQKDQIAAHLAVRLNINYQELGDNRILRLMNREEIGQLAEAGVDVQLHTHRHRTPLDEDLFRGEIRDNRNYIASVIGGVRKHFCYPSGAYRPEFLTWLAGENIVSATTCDTGFATAHSNPLLLPRLVDTMARTDLEFESWVSGVGSFLSRNKRGRHAYLAD